MASYGNPVQPFLLQRSISIRAVYTRDGYMVSANKHFSDDIEHGTLADAIRKGYITYSEAENAPKKIIQMQLGVLAEIDESGERAFV